MEASEPQAWQRNVFVLCFDVSLLLYCLAYIGQQSSQGTGNKFGGTEADSNILKLFRMLDRSDATMYTFYQPGIGTYITSNSVRILNTIYP